MEKNVGSWKRADAMELIGARVKCEFERLCHLDKRRRNETANEQRRQKRQNDEGAELRADKNNMSDMNIGMCVRIH